MKQKYCVRFSFLCIEILEGHWTTSVSSSNYFSKKLRFSYQKCIHVQRLHTHSLLLNFAPATIILVWRKVLWTYTKINWLMCKLWHFGLEQPCFKQQLIWIPISLIPSLCMLNKNWWFLHFLKDFLKFFFLFLFSSNHLLHDK